MKKHLQKSSKRSKKTLKGQHVIGVGETSLNHIKKKFREWLSTHQAILDDYHGFWHLQNFVGDLVKWNESPHEWLTDEQRDRWLDGRKDISK